MTDQKIPVPTMPTLTKPVTPLPPAPTQAPVVKPLQPPVSQPQVAPKPPMPVPPPTPAPIQPKPLTPPPTMPTPAMKPLTPMPQVTTSSMPAAPAAPKITIPSAPLAPAAPVVAAAQPIQPSPITQPKPPQTPPLAPLKPAAPLAPPKLSPTLAPTPAPVGTPLPPLPQRQSPSPLKQPLSVPVAASQLKPPQTPPTPAGGAKPQVAEYRRSPFRFLPYVLGIGLLALIAFFIYTKFFGQKTPSSQTGTDTGAAIPSQTVTLTYWGLWEPNTAVQQVFTDFEKSHPGVHVSYQQQQSQDYRERLQTAISSGRGPDVFRFHASWTPMLQASLSPVPSGVMTLPQFQSIYYPVAAQQLTIGQQIAGIPLEYDGLELYYNVDALKTANAQVPTTWSDLETLAKQLTVRSGGKIQRAGVAMGNASNVEHFSDILALLMLQNGASLSDPTSEAAQSALTFYTNFVKKDQVWDDTLPSSTIAFARGDVAMMFAPSWRAHDIKALNPNLSFKIAPVPQLSGNKITWASYWAEGVSAQSQHKNEAWKLIQYLSSPDVMRKLYAAESSQRAFGEPYARKDMAGDLAADPYVSPYLQDAQTAKGWFLSSYTHDAGINDFMIKYYQDAVNAVLGGTNPSQALTTVSQGTQQVLRQYNVSSNGP